MQQHRWFLVLGVVAAIHTSTVSDACAQVGSPSPGTDYNVTVRSNVEGNFGGVLTFVETSSTPLFLFFSQREGTFTLDAMDPLMGGLEGTYSELNLKLPQGSQLSLSHVTASGMTMGGYNASFAATYVNVGPVRLLTGSGTGSSDDTFTFQGIQHPGGPPPH